MIINLGLLPTLPKEAKGKWGAEGGVRPKPWSCMRFQVTGLLWFLDFSKGELLALDCTGS